jgi:hypothetical protein
MVRPSIRHIVRAGLSASTLLISAVVFTNLAHAGTNIVFSRAIKNEEVYAKDPGKYRRVVVQPSSLNQSAIVYYVERTPALRIPAAEVESAVAQKNPPDPFMDALTEEVLRSRGKGERLLKDDSDDNILTFTLTAKGGELLREFANKHPNELFEVIFAGQRLGFGATLGRFEGNIFQLFATKNTINRLRKSYPRLKVK